MRGRIPTDWLSLRLEALSQVDDVQVARGLVEVLETEATLLAWWTPAQWQAQRARWARARPATNDARADLCE